MMKMVRVERQKCKLCSRSFSNGRALGGHMRSHLANLPLPPKTPQKEEQRIQVPAAAAAAAGGDSTESSSTSSECSSEEDKENNIDNSTLSSIEDQKGAVYELRKNSRKSFSLATYPPVEYNFPGGRGGGGGSGGLVVIHNVESETESTKKPTRRRSKRTWRMLVNNNSNKRLLQQPSSTESRVEELEQVSTVSNTTDSSPEEDLAMCLVMLSRDVWSSSTAAANSDDHFKIQMNKTKKKKKKKTNCWDEDDGLKEFPRNVSSRIKTKVHECPFCGKVFGSGQALGGHKRTHLLSSTTTLTAGATGTTGTTASATVVSNSESLLVPSSLSSNSAKFQHSSGGEMFKIDLNLPAPMEEEEENDDHHHHLHHHHHDRNEEDLFMIRC